MASNRFARHNVMAKLINQAALNSIVQAIAPHLDGITATDLSAKLSRKIPSRTQHRYLTLLAKEGRIALVGVGRARRYAPVVDGALASTLSATALVAQGETYVPLSAESESIKRAVRKPISERKLVGYQRAFLDTYRPNESFYLPLDIRQRLFAMGRATESERPAGTYARQIMHRLLIDLSWNSSRLEGNTYSLLETQRLIERGESAEGKDALETQMLLNHKAAIEFIVEAADEVRFNRYTILNLHALLSENLLRDTQACGRLRAIPVAIAQTTYIPLDVPQLISECFQRILDKADVIRDPFEQALFAMVHLPYLHPFEDVNKRVSRLAANVPLVRNNLCPLSFVDVPERAYLDGLLGVYEQTRIELLRDVFVWAYERSCARYSVVRQNLGEPDAFRLRYRNAIANVVAEVVRNHLDKKSADALIKLRAAELAAPDDTARFIEVVETETTNLHEGNIARYRIRPSEFEAWRNHWR